MPTPKKKIVQGIADHIKNLRKNYRKSVQDEIRWHRESHRREIQEKKDLLKTVRSIRLGSVYEINGRRHGKRWVVIPEYFNGFNVSCLLVATEEKYPEITGYWSCSPYQNRILAVSRSL